MTMTRHIRVEDALEFGVSLPAETRDDGFAYGWHADWTICTTTRTATHRTGLSYSFAPWDRTAIEALPKTCTWPPYQWVGTLQHAGRTNPGLLVVLRRCLEACRLFSEDGMFLCFDCNVDTSHSGDYYMVRRELWKRAMPDEHGMLCLSCLKNRLGRDLVGDDFTECVVNTESAKVRRIRGLGEKPVVAAPQPCHLSGS